MIFKCPFCPRTFSTRSACTQHTSSCLPPPVLDYQSSSEESDFITDINNMSLGSEGFFNVDEVKKQIK